MVVFDGAKTMSFSKTRRELFLHKTSGLSNLENGANTFRFKKKQITTFFARNPQHQHHSSTFCNLFPSMNPLIMHNYCTFQWVIFWQVTTAAAHTTAAGHIVVPTSAVERASLAAWVGVNRLPLKRCQSATRLVVVLTNCGVGRLVSKLYKAVFLEVSGYVMIFHHWCPGASAETSRVASRSISCSQNAWRLRKASPPNKK